MNQEFWYGNEEEMGMKEKLKREEVERKNRGEERIMERPVMSEEDLVKIVKKQKSGKAVGADGIRAEVMTQMIEDKNIRKSLTKACNQCLDEKVNKRWLE